MYCSLKLKEEKLTRILLDLSNDIANLSIDSRLSTTPSPFENKFADPNESHFGTIAKLYDQSIVDSVRICGVYEFIGILGDTPLVTLISVNLS